MPHRFLGTVVALLMAFVGTAVSGSSAAEGTEAPGAITVDTRWALSGSPYHVAKGLVVFPGAVLTIDPGVTVLFDDYAGIEVRGRLISEGTKTSRIAFTWAKATGQNYWAGIRLNPATGGTATFAFADISLAIVGITALASDAAGDAPMLTVRDSSFTHNQAGINASSYRTALQVQRSFFANNDAGIIGRGRIDVCRSAYYGNKTGFSAGVDSTDRGSTYSGNGVGASQGVITSGEFYGNKQGVAFGAVATSRLWSNEVAVFGGQVELSNLSGNRKYAYEYPSFHLQGATVAAPNNWWGSTQESAIAAVILDAFDDPKLGIVNFKPPLSQAPTYQEPADCPGPRPMNAPSLVADSLGSVTGDSPLELRWEAPSDARRFHLQLVPAKNDGPGVDSIFDDARRVEGRLFTLPEVTEPGSRFVLLPGMSYTWRVRASNSVEKVGVADASWGPWSPWGSFSTSAVSSDGLTPLSPPTGADVGSVGGIQLAWAHPVSRIFYWEIQVSTDAAFDTDPATATAAVWWMLIHGGVTQPPNSWQTPPVARGVTYYWRVRPRVQGDGTPVRWGPTWTFRTL